MSPIVLIFHAFGHTFSMKFEREEEEATLVTIGESQEELALEDKGEEAELRFGFQALS